MEYLHFQTDEKLENIITYLGQREGTIVSHVEEADGADEVNIGPLLVKLASNQLIISNMNSVEKQSVCSFVDSIHSNCITFLQSTHPSLKEDDLFLISLLKLGFTTEQLTFIFEYCGVESLRKRKCRLKEKLELPQKQILDEYIRYMMGGAHRMN
jgi:hypothetical protein